MGDEFKMKKFVAFSLATLLIILSALSVSASSLGDTDYDGKVGVMDATVIQLHMAQKIRLDDDALKSADVDGDGIVSIMDCTTIQQFVAQLIDVLPAENNYPKQEEESSIELSTNSGLTPGNSTTPEPSTVPSSTEIQEPSSESNAPNAYDLEVLKLVNIEREKVGLHPLEYAYFIYDCAKIRAIECAPMDNFSHTRPDGRQWYTVFDDLHITNYRTLGENLAWGHETAHEVMYDTYGWMNSPGHKANILNGNFTHIAIASVECVEQPGTFTTVQLFWG